VPAGDPLVTLSIVAYGLVSVSAVTVPLLEGVNVYHTLFACPPLAAPAGAQGGVGSLWVLVFAVATTELTVSLYGNCTRVTVIGVALSSFGGATSPASILNVNIPPAAAGLASDTMR